MPRLTHTAIGTCLLLVFSTALTADDKDDVEKAMDEICDLVKQGKTKQAFRYFADPLIVGDGKSAGTVVSKAPAKDLSDRLAVWCPAQRLDAKVVRGSAFVLNRHLRIVDDGGGKKRAEMWLAMWVLTRHKGKWTVSMVIEPLPEGEPAVKEAGLCDDCDCNDTWGYCLDSNFELCSYQSCAECKNCRAP